MKIVKDNVAGAAVLGLMVVAATMATFVATTAALAKEADPALGLWQTEPDRKNLTSHVEIRPCGDALCGRIMAAFDPQGHPVVTPNVGKALFWDLRPEGAGQYGGGTVMSISAWRDSWSSIWSKNPTPVWLS